MRRRWITAVLVAGALAVSSGVVPATAQTASEGPCPADTPRAPFTDVPAVATHADAIACAVARNIVEGRTATTFAPAADVTRGQFASLLARTLDELDVPLPPAAGGQTFPDAGTTHGQAIHRLAAAGIVAGRADGTFGPSQAITRDQLATLAVRAWSFVLGAEVSAEQTDRFDDVEAGPRREHRRCRGARPVDRPQRGRVRARRDHPSRPGRHAGGPDPRQRVQWRSSSARSGDSTRAPTGSTSTPVTTTTSSPRSTSARPRWLPPASRTLPPVQPPSRT